MFEYDFFLSYSSKDKTIVYALADRLKNDGLRVWLDKWEIKPGDSIPLKIQRGLESSSTILVCMSPAYFESYWGWAEHLTQLFEDPINKQGRLIPVLIADCIRPKIIAHLSYIDWRACSDEAYDKIYASCLEKRSKLLSTNINYDEKINIPQTFTSSSTGMEFELIPAGTLLMGSPLGENGRCTDEGPAHVVRIENSFYLGKYPITQKQWEKIMENNPSNFRNEDLPVESVSWNEVQEFVRELNEKESTEKYRLPSEAEWEYACRAGKHKKYFFGDDESKLNEYSWYRDNSGCQIHPVGQKKPNPFDLYDMYGNVDEWVQDFWHKNYINSPDDARAWEDGDSLIRVCRGGGCNTDASGCRSASRSGRRPTFNHNMGFRLLKEL